MSRRGVLRLLLAAAGGASAFRFGGKSADAAVPPAIAAPPAAPVPPASESARMEPFEIDFDPALIEDLHRRIDHFRWPEIPFDTAWTEGTDDGVLRELVSYWRNEYDWFAVQTRLNELEHLRGPIEGEAMHCVVYEGAAPRHPVPLLLLHGWPSSFFEFTRAAELLTSGTVGGRGFDLVVPSLPGFALSEAPQGPGMHPGRIADRLHLLMRELGHERYGVQGGDWGAIIGSQMARRHPDAVVGFHTSFVASAPSPPDGTSPSAEEEAYRAERARFQAQETGYSSIQGTKPQTLAYAQQDSPVGWLAWILEKFHGWSDHGDGLWETFDRDDVLTTAMLYWLPGRILSAARIYLETSRAGPGSMTGGPVEVPTGYARFPAEPWAPPREVVARNHNLVHFTEMPRGGHFPALEQPELWAGDVADFFGTHTG